MKSLVAELQAAGAAAQQLERQKNAASDFKRQFDCAPGALALVVGHNGQRLREIERPRAGAQRCVRTRDGGVSGRCPRFIEGATRDAVSPLLLLLSLLLS